MTRGSLIVTGLAACLLAFFDSGFVDAQAPSRPSVETPADEMILIPAGQVDLGSSEDEVDQLIASCKKAGGAPYECEERYDAELPRNRVNVDSFYLDKTEVTNAQFDRFVRATDHKTTAESQGKSEIRRQKEGKWVWENQDGLDWRHPYGAGSTAPPTHPVVHVSWTDAAAYCKWAGMRLPTEAEWEYAARGTVGNKYPWGNRWGSARARNFDNRDDGTTAPVGSYPSGASPFGILDLAGNVWEWTSSLFRPYPYDPTDGRENSTTAGKRVPRGGGWNGKGNDMRAARRGGLVPSGRNNVIGFRCARTP